MFTAPNPHVYRHHQRSVLVAFVVCPGLGPHPTRVRHNYVMYFRFGYLSGIGVARIFDRGGGGPVNDPLDSSLDISMLDSSLFYH